MMTAECIPCVQLSTPADARNIGSMLSLCIMLVHEAERVYQEVWQVGVRMYDSFLNLSKCLAVTLEDEPLSEEEFGICSRHPWLCWHGVASRSRPG